MATDNEDDTPIHEATINFRNTNENIDNNAEAQDQPSDSIPSNKEAGDKTTEMTQSAKSKKGHRKLDSYFATYKPRPKEEEEEEDAGQYQSPSLGPEMSEVFSDTDIELSVSRSETFSRADSIFGGMAKETLTGNPEKWRWPQVKAWLKKRKFEEFEGIFEAATGVDVGIDGAELLDLTTVSLFTEGQDFYEAFKDKYKRDSAIIQRFFKLTN